MITHENTLSERERFVLAGLASDSDAATTRRAQALIEWSKGESTEEIAESAGLRASQVRSLTRAFSQKRLEVFSASSIERAGRGFAGRVSVGYLLEEHHVDVAHARYVAGLALQIFDASSQVHQLSTDWRRLLETGAMLHNLGVETDDDRHQQVGRDIILSHELESFSPRERDILALLVSYHRKKVKASRDPIFSELDEFTQRATLALAAILRVADGLDYSRSQTTMILSTDVGSLVNVVVEGPQGETDVARAGKKADLWRQVLTPPFYAHLPNETLPSPRVKRLKPSVSLKATDPVTKAGKKIIRAQFVKLQSLEDEVRRTSGVEAVHDMRVATRRMRSAFRLLGSYYSKKDVKKIRGPLQVLAGCLGAVRDLDVLIDNLDAYVSRLSLEQQRALDPLRADWQARRAQADRELVEFMDSGDYDDWLGRLEDFLERKGSGGARVADVVPAKIWKLYSRVREYETRLKEPELSELHALRIECKRLRYALEFFAEVMGNNAPPLLEPLIALQDHLGEHHDAYRATQLIAEFMAARARYAQRHGASTNFEGVTAYLGYLQGRMKDLQTVFPDKWSILPASAYRSALAEGLAAM